MNALTGILLGAGVAGVGVLVLRKLQQQPEPEPEPEPETGGSDSCARAAALAEQLRPGTGAGVYTACKLANGVLDLIAGANDKAKKHDAEEKRRDAVNKQLNGATKIAMPGTPGGADVSVRPGVTGDGKLDPNYRYDESGRYIRRFATSARGTVLEYANGCQPFAGAPGWSKCAPGTQDMWARAIDESLGYFAEYGGDGALKTEPAFPSLEAYEKAAGGKNKQVLRTTAPSTLLTGSARLDLADPMTQGPFQGADGRLYWIYKGTRINCPVGQTPDAIRDAAAGVVDHRTNSTPACVPVDGSSPWTTNVSAPPTVSNPDGHTRVELKCNGTQAPAGYTWIEATSSRPGHWERLRAGQTPNPGPCATAGSTNVRDLLRADIGAGNLAVMNGGLSRMQ